MNARINWRLVLGFLLAWAGATGALVAADIAAAPAVSLAADTAVAAILAP